MEVKNDIETAVKTEVSRMKKDPDRHAPSCWCALCEADVTALALNSLPPRYCTTRNYGIMTEKYIPGSVRGAVQGASLKVTRRPKHRPGISDARPAQVRLVNLTFEEGSSMVGPLLMRSSAPCSCPQCRSDTLAFALNRYPPKYGVEFGGKSNFPPSQKDFVRHELGLILTHAAKVVADRPNH